MDALTTRPSLLSAAKNFIRKSAGTAVVVIAPLAAVSVASEARAQAVFGISHTSGAYAYAASGSFANSSFPSGGLFSVDQSPVNGITGVRTGFNVSIATTDLIIDGNLNMYYDSTYDGGLGHNLTTGVIADGTALPFAYNFTLTPSSGLTVTGWNYSLYLYDSSFANFYSGGVTGTGTSDTVGSTTFNISSGSPDFYYYSATLTVSFNAIGPGETLDVVMNQGANQGLTLNPSAIPEPSTYAAILGLGALGLAGLARRRGGKAPATGTPVTV